MARVLKHPALKEPLVFPKGTSDFEMYAALADKLFPVEELPPPPKEEAGFTGGFGEGISTLGGLPEAARYLISPTAERRKAAAEAGESEYEFQRARDIEGLGSLGRFVKEQAGSALGYLAVPAAAARTAAMVAPPPLKPFAATGAFLTGMGAQYFNNRALRHAAVQEERVKEGKAPELPDVTKMALTSAAAAGLDVAGFRLFRPLGEMIGLAGRKTSEEVAKEVAEITAKEGVEAGAKRLLGKKSIAAGAVTGAAFEAAQEVAQQALERYGVGLDLASDDALEEYFEAAVGGGLLGAPLGGVSTYAGNVRKGVYNKDFLKETADSLQGKQVNLGEEWDNYSKQIQIDAPTFDLTDDQGNFLKYTPDLLERLGINPEAKAINIGGRQRISIPMKDVLEADTGNETIGTALLSMFRNDRLKLSEEIKKSAKLMEPEVLAEKVKEYETLTAALKTYEAFFNPKQAVNSPTNFVVQQSPTDPKKFVVFNPVTGRNAVERNFASAENAQKYIDGQLEQEKKGKAGPEVLMPEDLEVQADPVKTGVFTVFNKKTNKYDTKKEFKTKAEAQEYIDKKLGVPPAREAVAAQQAQDVRTQLYKDLAARYPNNPDAVKEITAMAEDLETTMSPTDALAQAETTYLQDQEAAQPSATPPAQPPAAPEVGFRTAQGSLYSVDEQGKTSRTKLSEGAGKGKTYEPHSVLYVKPEDAQSVIDDFKTGAQDKSTSISLGYKKGDVFSPVNDASQIPEGATPLVGVVDTKTKKAVGVYPATFDPQVGLSPVETLYKEDGTGNVHVGNPIVEIFGKPTGVRPTPAAPSKVKQEKNVEDVLDFNNLEASLEGYLDPETEGMRQNYVYSNQSKNEYAKAAEENEAYQDALQQNLAELPDTVTMYRGRDKTKRYLDSIGPYLNVTTNKNIARNFAKTTKTNPENWVVESYEVPKSAIVALGHTEEREFLVNMHKGVQQITHLQKPMYEEEATIEGEVKEKSKALPSTKPKAPRARKAPTGQPYEKYTAQMREMLAGVDPESGLAEDLNEFINLAEESKDTTIAKELSQLAQTYAQATRDSTNPNLSQMEQDRALERASNIFETLKEVRERTTPSNAAEMKAAKDATGNADTGNKVAAKVTKDVCG